MTYAARSRSPFPTSFSRFGLNSNSIERPPHDGWIVRQGVRTRLLCGGRAPKAVRAYGPSPSWAPDSIRYLVQRSELRAPVIIQVRAKRGSAGVFSHRAKEADVSEAETARKEKEGGRKGVSRCKGRSIWFRFAESGDWQLHERLIRTPKGEFALFLSTEFQRRTDKQSAHRPLITAAFQNSYPRRASSSGQRARRTWT